MLSRLDKFEDILEGMTENDLKLLAFTDGIPQLEKISKELPQLQREQLQLFKIKSLDEINRTTALSQKSQFASCWHYCDRESLAMWDFYSQPNGFVIKIKPEILHKHVLNEFMRLYESSNSHSLIYGLCDYRPISPMISLLMKT